MDRFWINAEHTLGNPVLYKHYRTTIPPHFANLHTHNVELQVLLEFGVIGAVLVILTMCAGVARYWNDTRPEIVFFMAALSALAGATLVNFGLWEEWLLGVIAMTAILSVRLLQPDLPPNISESLIGSEFLTIPATATAIQPLDGRWANAIYPAHDTSAADLQFLQQLPRFLSRNCTSKGCTGAWNWSCPLLPKFVLEPFRF